MTNAVYHDGKSATAHHVLVTVEPHGLKILSASNDELGFYPFALMRVLESADAHGRVRIGCDESPDSRLLLNDAQILHDIARTRPEFLRAAAPVKSSPSRLALWALATAAALVGFYVIRGPTSQVAARMIPLAWEEQLGDKVVSSLTEDEHAVDDEDIHAALAELITRIAQSRPSPYTYHHHLDDRPIVNAFAAPGGGIVLYCGIIAEMESSDELAGVLAHEISHVVSRHSTEALLRTIGSAIVLTAVIGDFSGAASAAADSADKLLGLRESRANERAADHMGTGLLEAAHIRPDGLAKFFARKAKDASSIEERLAFFSTHPSDEERAAALPPMQGEYTPAMPDAAWNRLHDRCIGVVGPP